MSSSSSSNNNNNNNNNNNKPTRHDLDDAALGTYLKTQIPTLTLPITATKIGYGQSNPTYFIDDGGDRRYILRKKPSGKIISPVAHQVDREYRVLEALGRVPGFPVPKVYCLCLDEGVLGTWFYVSVFSPLGNLSWTKPFFSLSLSLSLFL